MALAGRPPIAYSSRDRGLAAARPGGVQVVSTGVQKLAFFLLVALVVYVAVAGGR